MNILVLDTKEGKATYHDEEVEDIYQFLKDNRVDVVINQAGHAPDLLKCFLEKGGKRWHDEGGKIISCLHFNPQPVSVHYQFSIKPNKTWHDYYVIVKSWLLHGYLYKRDRRSVGKSYREVYDMSDAYVMLSESYREYIRKGAGITDDTKLVAISNPLTFEDISDESILNKKKNTILVVSRLMDWQKRVSLSINAWEKLSKKPSMADWNMKIVGDGEDLEVYKDYVDKHNIERISFEGQQSPEPYYSEAKIFLMTSKTEGWGLTITESLQRGVVPIAFDTSTAFHEIINDGENGFLVKEGALGQYEKKIEMLANDSEIWSRMAKNALASANRFRLDRITEQWVRVIEK
jgi:glycosyltransferase involved in cell wall biosynthesis